VSNLAVKYQEELIQQYNNIPTSLTLAANHAGLYFYNHLYISELYLGGDTPDSKYCCHLFLA
jgi:hypothetical protein